VQFKIVTAARIHVVVLCFMVSSSLVGGYNIFEGHSALIFKVDVYMFLLNSGNVRESTWSHIREDQELKKTLWFQSKPRSNYPSGPSNAYD
jgi:hypothetical protein